MSYKRLEFAVKVTHIPTGKSAICTSDAARSMREAKAKAMKNLKIQLGSHAAIDSDFNYNFPDNIQWPNDPKEYLEKIK